MYPKMIQEGDVVDVPNPGPLRTVGGASMAVTLAAITLVGVCNEGGFEEDQLFPLIVRGHVNADVTAGAEAIEMGTALVIDQATGEVTAGDPDEANGIFLFGWCMDPKGVAINSTKRTAVRLPPQ